MPGTEESKVARLEEIVRKVPSLGRLFAEQIPVEQLLQLQHRLQVPED